MTEFASKVPTENDVKEEDIISQGKAITKPIDTTAIEHSDEIGSSTSSEVGAVNQKKKWWSNILELMSRKKNG